MGYVKSGVTKEDVQHLQEYPSVKRWLRRKGDKTIIQYGRVMVTLLRSRQFKNPDEFLEWCRTREDPLTVQDLIDNVADTVQGEGAKFNFQIAVRSFLRSNNYQLGKSNISYTLSEWHRGYKPEEIRKLLGFLDDNVQKLYVYLAVELGFRAQTILDLKWKHVKTDMETDGYKDDKGQHYPNSVRVLLGPEFYGKKKSAGYWCIGKRSINMLRALYYDKEKKRWNIKDEERLVRKSYMVIWKVLDKARGPEKANLDAQIQLSHGFRKYFENALDQAGLDKDRKALYEGHIAGVRAKAYTSRDWDLTVQDHVKAYPFIDPESVETETVREVTRKTQSLEEKWQHERDALRDEINGLKEMIGAILPAELRAGLDSEAKKEAKKHPETYSLDKVLPLIRELTTMYQNGSLEELHKELRKKAKRDEPEQATS